ncbi:helix-turn-helix transcriptional regulator [Vogesella indigofera]|uniref:helix-turn-helix transcriptional regulator n=1 Tax=Vogesella indigofera TaxID=45465 RepID=UPI00234E4F5A|nr:AraC family transcriptional regulator [Vogesella indigofera]MDC7708729.1 AraC family transcriptional regulator [Vogesella indigofera]
MNTGRSPLAASQPPSATHHAVPPAVRGHFVSETLRPGLSLHCTHIDILQAMHTESSAEPGLRLILMLEGTLEARFGKQPLRLNASRQPQGVLLSIAETEQLQRDIPQPMQQRQVVIAVNRQWFEEGGFDNLSDSSSTLGLCRQHLAVRPLQVGAALSRLAGQLLHPVQRPPHLQRLYQECHAVELLMEALGQLQGTRQDSALKPAERRRVEKLQQLLDSGSADGWSLAEMAREMGSNPTTLQRQFRVLHGCSIFDYLRRQRLARAHQLLLQGASVTEAALLASYGSPANFATAFRRQYGVCPRSLRR